MVIPIGTTNSLTPVLSPESNLIGYELCGAVNFVSDNSSLEDVLSCASSGVGSPQLVKREAVASDFFLLETVFFLI